MTSSPKTGPVLGKEVRALPWMSKDEKILIHTLAKLPHRHDTIHIHADGHSGMEEHRVGGRDPVVLAGQLDPAVQLHLRLKYEGKVDPEDAFLPADQRTRHVRRRGGNDGSLQGVLASPQRMISILPESCFGNGGSCRSRERGTPDRQVDGRNRVESDRFLHRVQAQSAVFGHGGMSVELSGKGQGKVHEPAPIELRALFDLLLRRAEDLR